MSMKNPTHTDLSLLEQLWWEGNVRAGLTLGFIHLRGKGEIPRDTEKGLDYLRTAAGKGSYRAAEILSLYFAGHFARPSNPLAPKYALARYWHHQGQSILLERIRDKHGKLVQYDIDMVKAQSYSLKKLWLCQDLVDDPSAPGPRWAKYIVRKSQELKDNPPIVTPPRELQYSFLARFGYYPTTSMTFDRGHRIEKPLSIINYLEDIIDSTDCPYYKTRAADRLYRETGKKHYKTRCMAYYKEYLQCEAKHAGTHCLMKKPFHKGILPSKFAKFSQRYRWKRVPRV